MFGRLLCLFFTSSETAAKRLPAELWNRTFKSAKGCCLLLNPNRKMSAAATLKPPNVLVYVGENSESIYRNVAFNLTRCLHPDKYVVYELKKTQILNSPWKDNVALLVVYCDKIEETIAETVQDYLTSGGKMLVLCSNLDSKKLGLGCRIAENDEVLKVKYKSIEDELVLYRGKYLYTLENSEPLATIGDGQSVIMKSKIKEGVLIVSEVYFALDPDFLPKTDGNLKGGGENRLQLVKTILEEEFGLEVAAPTTSTLSAGYIILQDSKIPSDLKAMKEISVGANDGMNQASSKGTNIIVPLLSETKDADSAAFGKIEYFTNLKTEHLGRVVFYFPVTTSTMIPAEQLVNRKDAVVIASRQVTGKGRGGNKWISPEGCAMFTIPITMNLTSRLGQRMSIIQHMASLSVVHGIRKMSGYEKLDLRLKWPNDLYFENDKKIGGVLVNSSIQGNIAHAYIGIGVNVANARPTVCINSIIESHNALTGEALPLLSIEKVIALTLNELEYLIDDFSKNGSSNFLKLYYTYWLHNEQKVTISAHKKDAFIHGLDDYGFLIVKTVEGKTMTLQPDGNRFDMLKNLIVAKE